jgi:hypothetical protein
MSFQFGVLGYLRVKTMLVLLFTNRLKYWIITISFPNLNKRRKSHGIEKKYQNERNKPQQSSFHFETKLKINKKFPP